MACRRLRRGPGRIGLGVLSLSPESLSADPELRLNSVLSSWTAVALVSLLGAFRRRNREEFARVVEHARLLETQRAQEVRLAALDERTRIAREMHDVLAHSLNVIVAQADGGRYAAAADPGLAVSALATVSQVGRESAAELHRLLGVLRDGEDRGSAPAPGIGVLPGLLEEYRRAGLEVRLVQRGSPTWSWTPPCPSMPWPWASPRCPWSGACACPGAAVPVTLVLWGLSATLLSRRDVR